jgi:HEPN domain-containing protein
MPPDNIPAGSAADWLRHARADLALSQVQTSPRLLELLCFHAQQACEKSLKGVLVHFGANVVKTHNLQTVLGLVANHVSLPSNVVACSTRTDYAVTTRYPGVYEPVNNDEYEDAIKIAEAVVQWSEQMIWVNS